MGYAVVIGDCFSCNRIFTFNPLRVPSTRDEHGARQPICKGCIAELNGKRKEMGLPPITIADDAYEPCSEDEL